MSERQRLGFKLRNLAFFVCEHASLWAHWIHSFLLHLSYLRPKLFSYLLAFPQLFSNQWWRVSICWITVLGALIRIWRPEISGGCDISNLLKWREIFSFHTDFHMTCCLLFPPKGNNNNSFVFLYQGANPEVGETVTSPRGLIRCWQRELPGPNRTSARSGLQGGLSHIRKITNSDFQTI